MDYSYTCITPFFNESSRIGKVLEVVTKMKMVNQVVCIDDGSTDDSRRRIIKEFPQVKVLFHYKNLGKAQAIATGLKVSINENIIIIDSDLKNLINKEVEQKIQIYESKHLDCLIMSTKAINIVDNLFKEILHISLPLEGCRIIRKGMAEHIFKKPIKGYQFEVLLNRFLILNSYKVAISPISAFSVPKVKKENLLLGFKKDLRMWGEILSCLSWNELLKQSIWVSRLPHY